MSTVLYRSESPYVPRPIETPRDKAACVDTNNANRALRILVVTNGALGRMGGDTVGAIALTGTLCELGHSVDFITDRRPLELDERARTIELAGLVRAVPRVGFLSALAPFSRRPMPADRLAQCLMRIADERASDYDLVIDNGTFSPGLAALKRKGLPLVSLLGDIDMLDRQMRKIAHEVDSVLAFSPRMTEERARKLGFDCSRITRLEPGRAASVLGQVLASLSLTRA